MSGIRPTLLIGLLNIAFVSSGCNRVKEMISMSPVTELREVSMDSLIERMVENDKKSLENGHKQGNTNTVGLVDGKKWMEDSFDKYDFLRGITDFVAAGTGLANAVLDEVGEKSFQHSVRNTQSDSAAALDAIRILLIRVSDVTSGRSFGDTVQAINKFYEDKPLLKDRPVIWVLAVPLYKQLQEAKPPDKRDTQNDTVPVPIKMKQKGKSE